MEEQRLLHHLDLDVGDLQLRSVLWRRVQALAVGVQPSPSHGVHRCCRHRGQDKHLPEVQLQRLPDIDINCLVHLRFVVILPVHAHPTSASLLPAFGVAISVPRRTSSGRL